MCDLPVNRRAINGHNTLERLLPVLLTLAVLFSGTAHGGWGSVISTWEAPHPAGYDGWCYGLAWDGQYIWCDVGGGTGSRVFKCIPTNGSVVASTPPITYAAGGMGYRVLNGTPCLDLVGYSGNSNYIYRISTAGSLLSSLRITAPDISYAASVEYDNNNYWVIGGRYLGYPGNVYKFSTGGSFLSSFPVNGYANIFGVARQGSSYLWVTIDTCYPNPSAYKMTLTGSVVGSISLNSANILDCAYGNNRLWIVNNHRIISCVDIGSEPGIEPASLGRVKAIFR